MNNKWTIEANDIFEGNNRVAQVSRNSMEHANLIAAAPELLNVAKLVLEMKAAMDSEAEQMPRSYQAPKSVDAIGIAIEHARLAIRKVEGR